MRVKVGDKIYDAGSEPVMVILTDGDKQNIAKMKPKARKFVAFPDSVSIKDIREWMKLPDDGVEDEEIDDGK